MSEKVVILCGGRGKRLGELTTRIPKPLVEIGGRTMLERKVESYVRQGFRDFVFCIGYKGEMIRKAVKGFPGTGSCEFSDEGEDAGMLKRISAARPLVSNRLILTYGDTHTNVDLKALLEVHAKSGNLATVVVGPIQNPFGLVEMDGSGRVTQFREKPILNYYIGYAVIESRALDLVSPTIIQMPDGLGLVLFYRILMAMEKLGAYVHAGMQVTFNTQAELAEARESVERFYTVPEDR